LAIRSLELRIKHWPQDAADGHFKLGMLYSSAELGETAQALNAFRRGLAALPAPQKETFLRAIPAQLRAQL
jgi:hypothetical protein